QIHQRREERHDRERDEDEDVRRGQAPHETTFTWSRRCSYGTPYTLGSLQPSASRSETRTRSPAGSRSTRARASYGCVPASAVRSRKKPRPCTVCSREKALVRFKLERLSSVRFSHS